MQEQNKVVSKSEKQTLDLASNLARQYPKHLVLLYGPLGAGKTLFARGFAAGINITKTVSSPTYTLMNEYRDKDRCMYHLDLYRINHHEEVIDLGLYEVVDAGFPCLIEWPERVAELTKLPHLYVKIVPDEIDPENCRIISWQLKKE